MIGHHALHDSHITRFSYAGSLTTLPISPGRREGAGDQHAPQPRGRGARLGGEGHCRDGGERAPPLRQQLLLGTLQDGAVQARVTHDECGRWEFGARV